MGKRSDFERIDKDFYRTIDPRAVEALNPHLSKNTWFAEPCAGENDLVRALAERSHYPHYVSDISKGKDALEITDEDLSECDSIITNPPWSRHTLHPMIDRFSALRPTWLLFDADWAHTVQSAPYMPYCRKIVSVGRLIWIPGTTTSGKDNCAWYLFDQNTTGPTVFVGRKAKSPPKAA